MTLEEFQRGQVYMIAKASKEEGGSEINVLVSEPFENENGKGWYTHKIFNLSKNFPSWLKRIVPANSIEIDEKSWNAFPYAKTIYVIKTALLGHQFNVVVTSQHAEDDCGDIENIHKLSQKDLKTRKIERIDIANDKLEGDGFSDSFVSKKTSRGPLQNNWKKDTQPIMCCYKLVQIEFNSRSSYLRAKGLQIAQDMVRGTFLKFHRQAWFWIDEWVDLTTKEVQQYDEDVTLYLKQLQEQNAQRTPPPKRRWGFSAAKL